MAQPNPNDTDFEQQRSDAAEASLKDQTEDNQKKDNESEAENIADNAEKSQSNK